LAMTEDSSGGKIRLEHYIYGVTPGEGYGIKATSKELNVALYDPKLKGFYTPIRGASLQAEVLDIRMLHPANNNEEILLSRINRGAPDELGRPTFQNHTTIVPTAYFRAGKVMLEQADRAMEEFDAKNPNILGKMDPVEIAAAGADVAKFGSGVRKHMSRAALETLASRLIKETNSRTLILFRDSTPEDRTRALYLIVELLSWGGGIAPVTSMSDAPTASAMNHFNLVLSPRGVRSDTTWVLIDAALEKPQLPRVQGKDAVYAAIEKCTVV